MNTSPNPRRSTVRTTGISPASAARENARRTLIIYLLCAVLPPLGLLILWRSRHSTNAMRAAASLLAVCVMTLLLLLCMDSAPDSGVRPTPVTPSGIGYGSVALPSSAAAVAPAPVEAVAPAEGSVSVSQEDVSVPVETDAPVEGGQFVYTVSNNPSVYHASEVCDGQVNRRQIALETAINEGLTPCSKCFTGVDP